MGRHKDIQNDKELNITSAELPSDYAIRLQLARLREVEENAERLSLDNKKKRFDLDKTSANLAYVDVVETSINRALGPIANLIKNFDQILTARLNLSGAQTEIVQDVIDDLLNQISAVDIHIETALETDARLSHAGTATRERLQREAIKTKKLSRKF